MVEITYQMVLSTLQTIGLLVGIVYYLIIMRNSQRNQQVQLETRQAQLFMRLFEYLNSEKFMKDWTDVVWVWEWTDYDDYWKKYGTEENLEAHVKHLNLWKFFDCVGILVNRGLVDLDFMSEMITTSVTRYWEKVEPLMMEYRDRFNSPWQLRWTEYLANEMIKLREKQSLPDLAPLTAAEVSI
jgi:hypothetical protein